MPPSSLCRPSRSVASRRSGPFFQRTPTTTQSAVRPELVVEVRYDKLEKRRLRHGTKLLRFRPDKDPEQCTWRELRPPRGPDDPTVEALLHAPEGGDGSHTIRT